MAGPPAAAPGWGPVQSGAQVPAGPVRSGSIVTDLDPRAAELSERPRGLLPRSSALLVVSLLVLGIAGGGGYMAWRQLEGDVGADVEVEETPLDATPEPEVPLPIEPAPEETGAAPLDPELPPTTNSPTSSPTPTPTASPTASPTATPAVTPVAAPKPSKKGTSSKKTGTTKKPSTTSKKTVEPAGPTVRPSNTPAANDPGRVLMELEYLSAIDKALKARNWAQALAYVEQHDRELPGGQLIDKFDERRIRALCGLGRTSEAQKRVTQILAKRPSSKAKSALAESCK